MKKRWAILSGFFFLLLSLTACSNQQGEAQAPGESGAAAGNGQQVELIVSAAASLKDAMDEIQRTYKQERPEVTLRFNFGSSGALQQQISQGAPVDVYVSAAEDTFTKLVQDGIIAEEDGVDLLGNALVLVVPKDSTAVTGFADLGKEEVDKISIGMPESVPAGKYAKESLEKLGIWQDVEAKMVYAKDVRQVLSYVETGNVDAGIVYKTDAIASEQVSIVATADPATHSPVIYPVGVIKQSAHYEAAKDLYHYLQSDAAIQVFEKYGFTAAQ